MTKRVFTSDLHFFHRNIVQYTQRGVSLPPSQDHTDWLIEVWNREVDVRDHVYHLGDFAFTDKPHDIKWLLNRLNGNKTFINGNHDSMHVWKQLDVYMVDYKEIKLKDGTTACLFHFPMAIWHKQHRGSIHLHGHSHGSYSAQGKILDVGIDSAYNIYGKHIFFTEDEIIDIMKEKQIVKLDHHGER